MSEKKTKDEAPATDEAKKEKAPKVVKHIDVRIEEAREDIVALERKLAILINERDNRAALEGITVGTSVTFEYGRGDKRRTMTGTVVATGDDAKQGRLLAVQVGEGLDIETLKIRAGDVQFDNAAKTDVVPEGANPLEGIA
jgi:hypothetical protein